MSSTRESWFFPAGSPDKGISIVIPSWNGLHLLRRHLPSVLRAARVYGDRTSEPWEIIVVDDGSHDGTTEALPLDFPDVQLVEKGDNSGFASACNSGFAVCRMPLVALLNNDVSVDPDYFYHSARNFQDPKVFAVTAKVHEDPGGLFATGGKVGRFRRGFWSVYFNFDLEAPSLPPPSTLISAYAVGGFATFDRAKLIELGGFNELLSPFHWEDIDLSYRAWKRGWWVLYEPAATARHEISATIDSFFKRRHVETIAVRNRLLFHWINLHSPSFVLSHLACLLLLLLTRAFVLDLGFYRSFFGALRLFSRVVKLRRKEKASIQVTDRALAGIFREFYRTAPIRVYYSRRQVSQEHPSSGAADSKSTLRGRV